MKDPSTQSVSRTIFFFVCSSQAPLHDRCRASFSNNSVDGSQIVSASRGLQRNHPYFPTEFVSAEKMQTSLLPALYHRIVRQPASIAHNV
jgi:hypothetical protein